VKNLKKIIENMFRYYAEKDGLIIDEDRLSEEQIWIKNPDGGFVVVWSVENELKNEDIIKFVNMMDNIKGSKIIICLEDFSQDVMRYGEIHNIELWGRKELAMNIGEYFLELYEKDEENMSDFPIFSKDEEEIGIEVEEFETNDDDGIPIFLEEIRSGGEEKIILPEISREEAKIKSKDIGGFRCEMRLLPYYLVEYKTEVIKEGDYNTQEVSGFIAVNAISKQYEIWKSSFKTTTDLNEKYSILQSDISDQKIMDIVKKAIIKERTEEIEETVVEDSTATIIEKVKIRPIEDTIQINILNKYYMPLWYVEGVNGRKIINAVSGYVERDN